MITFELYVQATEVQFYALQCFTKGFMVMTDRLLVPFAERKWKIGVSLLSIVVRADCVHPKDHFVILLILETTIKSKALGRVWQH